jgi:predicted ATPase/DNA-binding SARP family transcriptional activator
MTAAQEIAPAARAVSGARCPLALRLLGTFEASVHGEPLPPLRTRQGRWLLALLTLRAGQALPRGFLAATLWPDSPEDLAFANLRRALTDLRRALGAEAARLQPSPPNSLRLDLSGAEADVVDFDAAILRGDTASLQYAVSLYRGPLLIGCAAEWSLPEREKREQACLAALETLAAHALAKGEPEAAAAHLRRVITTDPLRECSQRRLMEALAASGEVAAAKRVYREFRLLLHRELNAEPDPETRALFERLTDLEKRRSPGRSTLPGFLPSPVSSLVGRQAELREIAARLHTSRLLTLTGEGGAGKTRLAIQAAEERIPHHAGGVWFVDLAPLADPELLPHVLASALQIRPDSSRPLVETLIRELQGRSTLVVLDNCEHLLKACAPLIETLLEGCRELRVLATSREPLRLGGEVTLPVPPLGSPSAKPSSLEGDLVPAFLKYDAVRLFVERACLASPGWRMDSGSIQAVAEICQRLDGNPLAIELAAARLNVLSVEQIAARLEDRFRLLTGGSRTALPRQQTLRATLEWSYDLLSEAERTLLLRLSVFTGGWTLEAAESVSGSREACKCGSASPIPHHFHNSLQEHEVLDLLTALVNKSLVLAEQLSGEVRYRLLETVRQYAAERLVEAGSEGADRLRRRHRDFFLSLAEGVEGCRQAAAHDAWLDRAAVELDNLRAALAWSLEHDLAGGVRLATVLGPFWRIRNRLPEGCEWLTRLLESSSPVAPHLRASTFWHAGYCRQLQEAPDAARPLYEQGLEIARATGDDSNAAAALLQLGILACERGDPREAVPMLEESVRLHRTIGKTGPGLFAQIQLGGAYRHLGETARAQAIIEEGLALARNQDEMVTLKALDYLGDLALDRGDCSAAGSLHGEKLALARSLGEGYQIAQALNDLARVSWQSGDVPAARAAQEEALAVSRRVGAADLQMLCLNHMAQLAWSEGDVERMDALSRESLELATGVQMRGQAAGTLRQLAAVAAAHGDAPRAARLLGASERLQGSALPLHPFASQELLARTAITVRAALGETGFQTAAAEGAAMRLEQMTAYGLERV